jgi:MSHA biogenesis protein MshJ
MPNAVDKIKQLEEKVDSLTVRERAMILLGVLAVIYFAWDIFFMRPLDVQHTRMAAQLETKRAELGGMNIQLRDAIAARQVDPDAENRIKLESLRNEIAALDQDIRATTRQLIDPARMTEFLRTVIHQIGGLTLTSLQGLGVSPLLTVDGGARRSETAADPGTSAEPRANGDLAGAYRHGMRIRFRGDYLTTLAYLRTLESLEWDFFWDSAVFEIGEYPEGETTITIHTLSLAADWIKA